MWSGKTNGRNVAVKQIRVRKPRKAGVLRCCKKCRPRFRNRFGKPMMIKQAREEIEFLKMSQSRFVLHLYDYFDIDRSFWLVTEQCVCHLRYIKREPSPEMPLTPPTLIYHVTFPIFKAVSHLHSLGIVHRDIKMENVCLNMYGIPKLCDFGMAERFKGENEPIGRDKVFGSPFYMPPEVVRLSEYSMKVDTWSLGVLLVDLFYHDGRLYDWIRDYVDFYLNGYKTCEPGTLQEVLYRTWEVLPNRKPPPEHQTLFTFIKKLLIFSPEDRPTVAKICEDEWFQAMYLPWVREGSQEFERRHSMLKIALQRNNILIKDIIEDIPECRTISQSPSLKWQVIVWKYLTFLYPT